MTGIERLHEFAAGISPVTSVCGVTKTAYDRKHMESIGVRLRDFLTDIADQIERERACDGDTAENIRLIVGGVVDEMERHVLGHEGMEDSPVARWARELREALGGDGRDPAADVSMSAYDLLPQEDRDAIAWVREHGGLDYVKSEWRSRVPYDRYERRRQRLLGHIAECETALGRRREIISELNHRASDLTRKNAELRKRAMPEGFEWPCFESGEPVMLGDSVTEYVVGGELKVRSIEFRDGATYLREGFRTDGIVIVRPGERVKRPAPKVLDADGEEIREKRDVWWICEGDERGFHAERLRVETILPDGLVECSPYNGGTCVSLESSELYVNKPVPASDGRPLRDGETVWNVKTGERYVVGAFAGGCVNVSDGRGGGLQLFPSQLTHERPDSFEQLEKDANDLIYDIGFHLGDYSPSDFNETGDSVQDRVRDLVRRAKKLKERDR